MTKSRNLCLNEIWEKGDFIQSAMSRKTLSFLLHALRFDNITDRQHRSVDDNLAPVRDMFQRFILNCQKNYSLGSMTTTDE
jgi:hypothetical protein